MTTNRKVVLAARPEGLPTLDCFGTEEEQLGEPAEGQVLVEVQHISIDAWISTTLGTRDGHHGSIPIGSTIPALGVGRVISSAAPELAAGDEVFGPMGSQSHLLAPATMFQKLDVSKIPARSHLGVLGLTTGMTAYVGMITVCVKRIRWWYQPPLARRDLLPARSGE